MSDDHALQQNLRHLAASLTDQADVSMLLRAADRLQAGPLSEPEQRLLPEGLFRQGMALAAQVEFHGIPLLALSREDAIATAAIAAAEVRVLQAQLDTIEATPKLILPGGGR